MYATTLCLPGLGDRRKCTVRCSAVTLRYLEGVSLVRGSQGSFIKDLTKQPRLCQDEVPVSLLSSFS